MNPGGTVHELHTVAHGCTQLHECQKRTGTGCAKVCYSSLEQLISTKACIVCAAVVRTPGHQVTDCLTAVGVMCSLS